MIKLAKTVLIKNMSCAGGMMSNGDDYTSGKADMEKLLRLLAEQNEIETIVAAGNEPNYDNYGGEELSDYLDDCANRTSFANWEYLADEAAGKTGYQVGIDMLTAGKMVGIADEQAWAVLAPLILKDGETGKRAMKRINTEADKMLADLIGDAASDVEYDEDDWGSNTGGDFGR